MIAQIITFATLTLLILPLQFNRNITKEYDEFLTTQGDNNKKISCSNTDTVFVFQFRME